MKTTWFLVAASAIACVGCKPAKAFLNKQLIEACFDNNYELAKEALDQGADPNTVDPDTNRGFTALTESVEQPKIEAMLLKAGASPNKPDANGLLPLGMAAAAGTVDSVEMLIKAGASIDGKDSSGMTAVSHAASMGKLDNMLFLVSCKAKLDVLDDRGWTPLFHAVFGPVTSKADRLTMIRFLVNNGVDVSHRDLKGRTAKDYAKTKLMKALGANSEEMELLTPKPAPSSHPPGK